MQSSGGESWASNEDELAKLIDVIEARYGWTDEQVLALPFARFIELAKLVKKATKEEQKERLVDAAFIGYQFYLIQPRSKKSKSPMKFEKWLNSLGIRLDEAKPIDKAAELARAYEAGEKATRVFKRRKPVRT